MAITTIHPITFSIRQSINYICNPLKTDDSNLLSFFMCSKETAEDDFMFAHRASGKIGKNLAFHLIQAFAPGEVTEDEAHKIGEELAREILGSKYSYVIATHNDKNHIHNHIVFCACDNIDHNKYHDCKRSYWQIRNASDRLCKEHNLSIVIPDKNSPRKSHSYGEWKARKEGTSWKARLKVDIKESLEFCSSYEQFLKRMRDKGYDIKNENPEDGKYITFKAHGQEKWIRGRESTLGKDFTREAIIDYITHYADNSDTRTNVKMHQYINNIEKGKLATTIDINDEKFQENVGLKIWAERENLKRMAHNYNLMKSRGFTGFNDLQDKIKAKENDYDSLRQNAVNTEHELSSLALTIKDMKQYITLKPIHEKYRAATNKEAVLMKYESELILFEGARKSLKDAGIKLRTITPESFKKTKDKYQELLREKNKYYDDSNNIYKEIEELKKLEAEIKKILHEEEREEIKKKREHHI